MSAGTRGKWSEGEVRKHLMLYGAYSSFAFHRLPDARAGSRQPTLADFLVMHKGRPSLLEVKEVKEHDYRLPHKNFDELKVSRMRSWALAGAEGHVLVCFRPGARTARWRYAPIDFFLSRSGGSWDMTNQPTQTLGEIMENLYGPPPTNRL